MITDNYFPGRPYADIGLLEAANRTYQAGSLPSVPAQRQYFNRSGIEPEAGNLYYFMPLINSAKEGSFSSLRADFPILERKVNGHTLVWLDNAATTQKPKCVIDAVSRFYSEYNSNVHRGAHQLAKEATDAYENAREKMRVFLGASLRDEVVFVRGTTEAINLVAFSWGMSNLRAGDEILLTQMEHHSNIVPWQILAQNTGAVLKAVPVTENGEIRLSDYEGMFTPRTRIAAAAHVSNVLGTINPVLEMADIAHMHGALFLVDGAQSAPHMPIDVKSLDCDFFALSGHKMYGPTGIGILYGKKELLDTMPPWQGGGGMIKSVRFERTLYEGSPDKFEAGTGNIADAVGLGAAADYLQNIGMEKIAGHEKDLTRYLMRVLGSIPGLRLVGTADDKTSVVSFTLDGADTESIARYLDRRGIAIRAGHHCAQPVHQRFGLSSTARASIGLYNTQEELDALINAVLTLAEK